MTKTHCYKSALLLLSALALIACSSTKTTVPISWRNPGYEATVFKKLLVIGVGSDDGSRRMFEDHFAKALAQEGATAQASWGLLPKSEQLTEEEVQDAIAGGDFDGVLITRLLGIEKDQEYVPGKSYSVPTTYYGYGYYGYYGTSYAVVHDPGYFKTNTTFRLETNLYAVSDSGLVWSGQSETLNPDSVADVIDSMTAAVAKKLKEEGLIP